MRRLLVTETGHSFGKFNDGSTVFISSSCQIVVETDKNNKQITHIVNFISNSLKQKVEQMINIRNRYFSPISLPPFMQQTDGYKKLLSPLTESIWNQHCQQHIAKQTITSYDGHTTLNIHNNNHKIHIEFPLNIKKEIKVTPDGSSLVFYHHRKQTQIQSIYNHTMNWSFPLHLISDRIQTKSNPKNTINISNKTPLPQIQQKSLEQTMAKLSDDCIKAIEYFHCMENGIPPNQIITVEWTLNVIYRIFNSPNYLVEIFVEFDDSYLVSDGSKQFMYHYISNIENKNKPLEYVYSTTAIPPIPPNAKQESSYDLSYIAQNAINLLENAYKMEKFMKTKTCNNISLAYTTKKNDKNEEKICLMSNEVSNYYIHPRFGEFTYYKDKRVKVYFSDRTMLELNSDWKMCTIITKYGEEVKNIDCNNPIKQFTQYIKHALNYANWCSLSKKEQLYLQQSQIKIQNDIQKQIDFSNRLIETQKITEYEDYSKLDEIDMNTESFVSDTNTENEKLIQSIQNQLNHIDKLCQ